MRGDAGLEAKVTPGCDVGLRHSDWPDSIWWPWWGRRLPHETSKKGDRVWMVDRRDKKDHSISSAVPSAGGLILSAP